MELSKTENQSAFAQAIKRRDGAMRGMLGMGSGPVGAVDEQPHQPQVGIWRIAGNRDRSGWTDTVANSAQSREGRPQGHRVEAAASSAQTKASQIRAP